MYIIHDFIHCASTLRKTMLKNCLFNELPCSFCKENLKPKVVLLSKIIKKIPAVTTPLPVTVTVLSIDNQALVITGYLEQKCKMLVF